MLTLIERCRQKYFENQRVRQVALQQVGPYCLVLVFVFIVFNAVILPALSTTDLWQLAGVLVLLFAVVLALLFLYLLRSYLRGSASDASDDSTSR